MTFNFINLSVLQHHPTQILDSVLNTNPGISEVIESFGIKHQEESKDKHLYSISLFSFFFPPQACHFGEEVLHLHAQQAKPKRINFSSMS